MIVWDQLIGTVAAVAGVIVPMLWKTSRDRRMQHAENQNKLDTLLREREYLVPHDHNEDQPGRHPDTPLTLQGITRRRKFNGK